MSVHGILPVVQHHEVKEIILCLKLVVGDSLSGKLVIVVLRMSSQALGSTCSVCPFSLGVWSSCMCRSILKMIPFASAACLCLSVCRVFQGYGGDLTGAATMRTKVQSKRQALNGQISKEMRMLEGAENLLRSAVNPCDTCLRGIFSVYVVDYRSWYSGSEY